ncbi:MAG: hypothetical protein K2X72_38960 [Reyranella sp.]|nr:hypothetical protein [Reyranella sp.]
MQTLQDDLPVRLIATPRKDLRTCNAAELLADVVKRNREGFDFFPVIEVPPDDGERIVGLVEFALFTELTVPTVRVEECMQHLSEDNLIGADGSILSFITTADRRPCRLVISVARIEGLVSLSDLHKLPVRAALFALIAYLEMAMAQAIRVEFPEPGDWKKHLSESRHSDLEEAVGKAKEKDTWIEDLLFTQFADKVQIIKKSRSFNGSKGAFERTMKEIQALRDGLAHANEYAYSRTAAAAVCETVRKIEAQIDFLRLWPSAMTPTQG